MPSSSSFLLSQTVVTTAHSRITGKTASGAMQSIPLKQSIANIDLISPLSKWIDERGGNVGNAGIADSSKQRSRQQSEAEDDQPSTFARMRTHAISVRAATNVGQKAVEMYLAEVLALNASYAPELESCLPPIHWVDAWHETQSSSPNPPMLFEQACLEFNLYAMVASRAVMDAEDLLLKQAAHGFQVAAGGFNHLRDEVVSKLVGTLTTDLTSTSLNFLSSLSLANAQYLFFEKAVNDGLRHALLAKLAQEASCMYKSAAAWASRMLELPPKWLGGSSCNGERLSALAQWHTVKDVLEKAETETGVGYGEAIVRLRIAVRSLESSLQAANGQGLGAEFVRPIRSLLATCKKDLTTVEKDNSTVYLEQLPQASSLPPIHQACIAKPLPAPIPIPNDPSLFQYLLPLEIATAVRSFRKSAAIELSNVEAIVTNSDTNCSSCLKVMGLPASLETEQEGSEKGISDATWARVESTRGLAGGFQHIVHLTTDVAEKAKKSHELIAEIDATIKKEEMYDKEFHERHGNTERNLSSLGEANSNVLFRELSKSNETYRRLWKSAQDTDMELMASVSSKRDKLSILQLSREELSERMPDETGVKGGELRQILADELSGLLIRLAEEKTARQHSLLKLKEISDGTELCSRLLESPGSGTGVETRLATELIREMGKEIRASVETQKALMEEIEAKNVTFQEARSKDGLSKSRADFCEVIATTVTDFHHIVASLNNGVTFYGDLIRRLARLNQNVLDAAYTMNLSRREIELSHAAQRAAKDNLESDREMAHQMNHEYIETAKPLPRIPTGGSVPMDTSSRTSAPHQATAPAPAAASFSPGSYPSLSSTSSNADNIRRYPPTITPDQVVQPLPALSAQPPPSDSPILSNKVKKLVDMGFGRTDVEAALAACQGNENLAISHLLSYGVDSAF